MFASMAFDGRMNAVHALMQHGIKTYESIPNTDHLMPTEIPLKQWRIEEAIRCGVTEWAIRKRLYGPWKRDIQLNVRRVNKRVVFVVKTTNPKPVLGLSGE